MPHWSCPNCGRDYAYDLEQCTWCRVSLEKRESTRATIVAITEVNAPSLGHEDVPYWCAVARADDGSQAIVKLDHSVSIGSTLAFGAEAEAELAVVGILGTGTMGRSLAELLLGRGHRVIWCGRSDERLAASRARLLDRLGRVMDEEQVAHADGMLTTCTSHGALVGCDVVIEAVVEEMEPKQAALAAAETSMRPGAILATNTSGLSIDELATALSRPEDFGAMHFFNPATRMRLVETAIGRSTSAETSEFLDVFARSLGKIPVRVAAKPAFAVNRALMPLLNEAVRELEEGVAPAESIDEAIRLGLNHPMGPLALADLIGLDVVVKIMVNLAERTRDETYAPRPLLLQKVADGLLGRKSGAGFYVYDPSRCRSPVFGEGTVPR
jgi:3-hydroxybutyryl-CoA dehydrogenase